MKKVKMVDLHGQYLRAKVEIDQAIQKVLTDTDFIQGSAVKEFESQLSKFVGGAHTISCGNGTDALQIAMMALDFKPRDEVILPAHTYVATAEVLALLRLTPVFAEVRADTFTIDVSVVEKLITKKTVAFVPVHLYGQCADMDPLMELAAKYNLAVIEDAAQALGSEYISSGNKSKAGTIGKIGTTSFFPSKNLGAYGDGGAMFTHDEQLAGKLRMIANHGQQKKYIHEMVGVNSRLDTLQAAILNVKLKYLDQYAAARQAVAATYDKELRNVEFLEIPHRAPWSTHVFHQYTIRVGGKRRDALKSFLESKEIPTAIYYPMPLPLQRPYLNASSGSFGVTDTLSATVLSLPIHTEMEPDQVSYVCESIRKFGG